MKELAKQLKEAGFPQRALDGKLYAPKDDKNLSPEHIAYKNEMESTIPTLEEVIEACEKKFTPWGSSDSISIQIYPDTAGLMDTKPRTKQVFASINKLFQGRGSTPLEAVCKLWLSINKK